MPETKKTSPAPAAAGAAPPYSERVAAWLRAVEALDAFRAALDEVSHLNLIERSVGETNGHVSELECLLNDTRPKFA